MSKNNLKPVKGYEEQYSVTTTGDVWSHYWNKWFKIQTHSKSGYNYVSLYDKQKNRRFCKLVHRLVAETYLNPQDLTLQVNHIDGNKSNNCLSNLEFVTASRNHYHAFEIGLRYGMKEENNPAAKLNREDIINIRNKVQRGVIQKQIAKEYNIAQTTISAIKRRIIWSNL